MAFRILEFFSGLGGWRYAFGGLGTVVAAYDISPTANAAYALNHGTRPMAREVASLRPETIAAHGADLWALSPPCQPFCRMGKQQGLADPRSKAFLNLLRILPSAPPEGLVLENVAGFLASEAHGQLRALLLGQGYDVVEWVLCPTQFGIPNQRPRLYLAASRRPLEATAAPGSAPGPIAPFLDEVEDPSLYLGAEALARHGPGLDLVTSVQRRTACFIGGYGQRYVGSGSFLRTDRGVRRFSPTEVARLLGLPPGFRFPEEIPLEQRYKLLGNGLSIPVARWVAQRVAPRAPGSFTGGPATSCPPT